MARTYCKTLINLQIHFFIWQSQKKSKAIIHKNKFIQHCGLPRTIFCVFAFTLLLLCTSEVAMEIDGFLSEHIYLNALCIQNTQQIIETLQWLWAENALLSSTSISSSYLTTFMWWFALIKYFTWNYWLSTSQSSLPVKKMLIISLLYIGHAHIFQIQLLPETREYEMWCVPCSRMAQFSFSQSEEECARERVCIWKKYLIL